MIAADHKLMIGNKEGIPSKGAKRTSLIILGGPIDKYTADQISKITQLSYALTESYLSRWSDLSLANLWYIYEEDGEWYYGRLSNYTMKRKSSLDEVISAIHK